MSLLLLTLERELLLAHIRTGCSAVKASESPKPMLQSSLRFYHVEFQNRERVWRPHVCSVCFRWKWRSPPPTTRAGSWAFVVFLSRPSSVIVTHTVTPHYSATKVHKETTATAQDEDRTTHSLVATTHSPQHALQCQHKAPNEHLVLLLPPLPLEEGAHRPVTELALSCQNVKQRYVAPAHYQSPRSMPLSTCSPVTPSRACRPSPASLRLRQVSSSTKE